MTSAHITTDRTARRISIRGVVQGVGFRPFVYRLARQQGIFGWVLNDVAGVEVHAEAADRELAVFVRDLSLLAPPAAQILNLSVRNVAPEGATDFSIRTSRGGAEPTVRISSDLAVCDECLAELRDRSNARFGYPYINCTNCGPRYSIIRGLPYDRAVTTMQPWPMCSSCRRQYEDPLDRRYHAQPIACGRCGPTYVLVEGKRRSSDFAAALSGTVNLLTNGGIVAIKGIGGYHLACDARNVAAVEALRSRKFRKEKPFALLVRDLAQAGELIELTGQHERLLSHVSRPIVLARARVRLPGVAPDSATLGVMLPSTPLHHLLFDAGAPSPLVMTSANRSSEPIAYRDGDAKERLSGIADALLVGERPIERRMDDSVVAVRAGEPFMIRRARGFAPAAACLLPVREPILALGSDLKNSIALVVDGEVFASQHIGDLGDLDTETALTETIQDLLAMYRIDSRRLTIVHDLHPEYTSAQLAKRLPARCHLAVQHHHAHIASVLAEHQLLEERVVGVALDGTGYGLDGTIWGGEVFVGSVRQGFERQAWLRPVLMPGGDAAARYPIQAAAAFIAQVPGMPEATQAPFHFPRRFTQAMELIAKGVRCFPSTSTGRLFDAVAALIGFVRPIDFEGQAATWLEYQASQATSTAAYDFPDMDFRPLLLAIAHDRLAGRPIPEIALGFHTALAAGLGITVRRICQEQQVATVALSGGVFQNELLLGLLRAHLSRQPGTIRVLLNQLVPANDGGIALGQTAIASMEPTS